MRHTIQNIATAVVKPFAIVALLLTLPVTFTACSDDNNDAPIEIPEGNGEDLTIGFDEDLSRVFVHPDFSCKFVRPNSNEEILVEGSHRVEGGKSVIRLNSSMPIGEYVLAAIEKRISADSVSTTNIGCTLKVGTRSNSIFPRNFDDLAGLFGSGTAEDPYRISTETGFEIMRLKTNGDEHKTFEGKYFKQMAPISLPSSYNKGLLPISEYSAYPFRGNYDGNNQPITYCAIRRLDDKSTPTTTAVKAAGLFGYVAGASFKNVVMVDPCIIGANASGAIVGAVLGIAGEEKTTTYFSNCLVSKENSTASEVFGTNFVGGLVGGIEVNALVMMKDCENAGLPVNSRADGSFTGGLLGGGTVNAQAIIDSCTNRGDIKADGTRCVGGLVGGVEDLSITNCFNYGNVTATKALGMGGVAGGIGSSMLAALINEGTVKGMEGVGGILGSTVIRKSDGSYNDVTVASCHNYAGVSGTDNVGGIVGESQALLADCYNKGNITASDAFAAGIIAYSPTTIATSCFNTGTVKANKAAAGIVARSSYYILGDNANLGDISAPTDVAGGIIALGGATGMVNYCNNFGDIYSGRDAGGIAGRLGDTRQLTPKDMSSILMTETKTAKKIMKLLKEPPKQVSHFQAFIKKGSGVIKFGLSVKDLVQTIKSAPVQSDLSRWNDGYEKQLPARNDELYRKMVSEVTSALPRYIGDLPGCEALPGIHLQNQFAFGESLESEEASDAYADTVHDRLAEIDEQVGKIEKTREIAIAAVSCVLAGAGMVVSGGTATAILLTCSAALSTVGTLTETMHNSIEVSQCVNFGDVTGEGTRGCGIIPEPGDYVQINDVVNAGPVSGNSITANAAGAKYVTSNYSVSFGKIDVRPFGSLHSCDNVMTYNSEALGWSYCTADMLSKKSSYDIFGFDFDDRKTWKFHVPAVATVNNNMYYSFQ